MFLGDVPVPEKDRDGRHDREEPLRELPADDVHRHEEQCKEDQHDRQAVAHGLLVGVVREGLRETGVFRHRERGHRQSGQRPGEDEGQADQQPLFKALLREDRAGREPEQEVDHQMDDREGPDVGVFHDRQFFLLVPVAAERVHRVGVAVEMDAADQKDRERREQASGQERRQAEMTADRHDDDPAEAQDEAHQRERQHRIFPVLFVPLHLRDGNAGEHTEGHQDGLEECLHVCSPPL